MRVAESDPACFPDSIAVSRDVAGRIRRELGRPECKVRGVGDDGDERRTASATESGPGSDSGNRFQTAAVDDSEPGNDFRCSAAGPVPGSVDPRWRARFSWIDRRSHPTAIAISMAIEYFFILISVLVFVLQLGFICKKTGMVLDETRHGIQ